MGEIKFDGNCSLGINENKLGLLTISLFPQPAKDVININGLESNAVLYQISNLLGQKIWSGKLASNTFDISKLQSGAYLLNIEGYVPVKFIKE
jgi:hypothetical protein